MRIYLIRHGESLPTGEDPGLTKKGITQAEEVAIFLKEIKPDKIITSNLNRAKQTFEEYRKICPKVEFQISESLNEIYRVLVGGPEKVGTSLNREQKDKKRAEDFFDILIKMNKENIAIFTHGNLIRYILSRSLNIDPKHLWNRLVISPGSVSVIEVTSKIIQVKAINLSPPIYNEKTKSFYEGNIIPENYLP